MGESLKMNRVLIGLLCGLLLSFASIPQSAQATSIDYGYLAQYVSPFERGYPNPTGFSISVAGITVTATAGLASDNVYLDSYFNGMPGGLGVCGTLDSHNQCTPSSDDNLSTNGHLEKLILTFSQPVTITEILFRNGLHETTFTGEFTLNATSYSLTNDFSPPGSSGTGTVFDFTAPDGTTDLARLYIEKITFTQVPEPSTLLLMGSGLVGMALVRRCRVM